MKHYFVCLFALTLLLANANTLSAQGSIYSLDKKIALLGESGFDYVSIDAVNHRLYVSHGTSVNVVDLDTEQPIGEIKDMQGNHGIAIANDLNKGFISDGRANA